MKPRLVSAGVLVWTGVGALSIGMAIWDEPVLGFLAIAARASRS